MTLNPFLCIDLSISDSLRSVRKSVLIYETIILGDHGEFETFKKQLMKEIILICTYEAEGENPELVLYKKR